MGEAWRIVKERHAASALDGEGARLHGGRWNSAGVRVVYTSFAKSLAALEILVHVRPPVAFRSQRVARCLALGRGRSMASLRGM